MKWSFRIGRLAGTELRLHATSLLLVAWVGMRYWAADQSAESLLSAVGFIACLFACLACHEFAHALAARRFGIETRDVTLLPVGGVTRLKRIPETPIHELWVAIAGPAANAVIALHLYFCLSLNNQWEPLGQLGVAGGPFLERLMMANIALVLFNLIPAFPMDGGRAVRALLSSRMSYQKATQVAASAGQCLGVLLALAGLLSNPALLFIGLFVWIGASPEACAYQLKSALSGTPARLAMLTVFDKLQSEDTLAAAVRSTLEGWTHDIPVLEGERVVGILTRTDLLVALSEYGQDHPVEHVMNREFMTGQPDEMLATILRRLKDGDCHTMPILHDGALIGLITMQNLGEYLVIEASSNSRKAGGNGRVPAVEQAAARTMAMFELVDIHRASSREDLFLRKLETGPAGQLKE